MGEVIDFRPRVIGLGLTAHDRAAIEAKIEELIAFLDDVDGDPDLEPEEDICAAGDDGCGFHQAGWSSGWGAIEGALLPTVPCYGIDQSSGPINEVEARHSWEQSGLGGEVR